MIRRPPRSTFFPYPPSSRSADDDPGATALPAIGEDCRHGGFDLLDHGDTPGLRVQDQLTGALGVEPCWGNQEQKRESRGTQDRKSTRLNSSHQIISYAVFCL